MKNRILVINPGSTSTKIAVFENEEQIYIKNIKHSSEELVGFKNVTDQYDYRKSVILEELKMQNIDLNSLAIIIGRGGLIKPVKSGVYKVNELMKEHLRMGFSGEHASNLGGLIADSISQALGLPCAYIADPVVVDELQDVARITGHPLFEKISIFHALNQKVIARTYAKEINKKYEDLNLIVVHMGGGISVGAHCKGMVIDVNQALDGDGPFSPERSGTLPMNQVIKACFSGKYSFEDMRKMIVGKGGYVAYFGSNDAYAVEKAAIDGNPKAELLEEAMAYQVSKEIGGAAVVLKGKIDAILITGGIAYGKPMIARIKKYIDWIAPVFVYPGEDEMKSLAMNALLVMKGELVPETYV